VQTVFVLAAALLALMFTGSEIWRQLGLTLSTTLGHLHSFPVTPSAMQKQFIDAVLVVVKCVWPVLLATILGGLLAGGIQSRFQTASEALTVDWGRVNPATGFKRLVSMKAAAPAAMAVLKLSAIILLSYGEVKSVLSDPIFYSTVSAGPNCPIPRTVFSKNPHPCRIGDGSDRRDGLRLPVLEDQPGPHDDQTGGQRGVKEHGSQRRGQGTTETSSPGENSRADVAGRVDSRRDYYQPDPSGRGLTLRSPKDESPQNRCQRGSFERSTDSRDSQTTSSAIIENKPLARMMFRYGKVGGEIPAQLYAAVAEVLAWVYRTNRYRYYVEQNRA
jgi:flagellar biosynthetic protein FlhB